MGDLMSCRVEGLPGRCWSSTVALVAMEFLTDARVAAYGVGVQSLTNGIVDTTTAHGKLIFGMFALMAEYESGRRQPADHRCRAARQPGPRAAFDDRTKGAASARRGGPDDPCFGRPRANSALPRGPGHRETTARRRPARGAVFGSAHLRPRSLPEPRHSDCRLASRHL